MSMGSSGGGSSTTTTKWPAWLQPYANQFLTGVQGQVLTDLAGMNPNMTGGENTMLAQNPIVQQMLNGNANAVMKTATQNPAMNPYLNQYYNAAARPLQQQFEYSTDPALMAQAQQAGDLNSSGFQTAQGQAQSALAQGLGTLGAGIYEPAWQQGEQLQQNAQQMLPTIASSLYGPGQQQYAVGQAQAQWPFSLWSEYGSAIGQAGGGTGTTISTSPSVGGFK